MTSARIIRHEATPDCGSYEVRYSDGRPSRFFYWEDDPGRRLDPNTLTGEQALELAKLAAGAQADGLNQMQPWVNFIEH